MLYRTHGKFIAAVNTLIPDEIIFPESLAKLQCASHKMDKVRTKRHEFHCCVGAIDGYSIRIRQPRKTNVHHHCHIETERNCIF